MLSKSILFRLVVSVLLIVTLLVVLGQSSIADTTYTLTITGNNDLITFVVSPQPSFPIHIIWGVNNEPPVHQDLVFTNHTLQVVPPLHVISLFINVQGVTVSTGFTPLTNDGWYAVPSTHHTVTITGDITKLVLKTNFDPREEFSVLLGIPNQPAQHVILDFIDTTATLIPPPNTRSLLFNHHDVEVVTNFEKLFDDGWYRIPLGLPVLNHKVFLPITLN